MYRYSVFTKPTEFPTQANYFGSNRAYSPDAKKNQNKVNYL